MILPELNIQLDTLGSASISASVFTDTINRYMGNSSYTIVGIKTGSVASGSSDLTSNVLNYTLNPTYYNDLTNYTNQTIITKNGLVKDTVYENI